MQDLMALYTGKRLPVLKLQYKDFSAWQNQLLRSEKIRSQEELTEKLFAFVKKIEGSIYMVLLAVCIVLLGKYSGQEDIVVGTPINTRRYNDLQNILGIFVNMLPMRNLPKRNKTFREFLAEVKENAFNAHEN